MKPVRRIIVAQDKDDKSIIVSDENAKDIDHFITGVKEAVSINVWATDSNPIKLSELNDPTEAGLPFLPARHGSIFRICDIPSDSLYIHKLDQILLNGEKLSPEQQALQHPLMHKIDAIIYSVVLTGEVTLIVDKTKTILKAGDVVVDYGSHHAWSNHTDTICRMAFVLLDANR